MNLFCAGRCADSDRIASSAIRVMGTTLATGQAAGTAAALTASTGLEPRSELVRDTLLKQGALLDRHKLAKAVHVDEPAGPEGLNQGIDDELRGH